jgi:hypothetical protein
VPSQPSTPRRTLLSPDEEQRRQSAAQAAGKPPAAVLERLRREMEAKSEPPEQPPQAAQRPAEQESSGASLLLWSEDALESVPKPVAPSPFASFVLFLFGGEEVASAGNGKFKARMCCAASVSQAAMDTDGD